jgi:hypothetical protein
VGVFDDALGDGDVFFEGVFGAVDHDGSEAAVDAGFAGRDNNGRIPGWRPDPRNGFLADDPCGIGRVVAADVEEIADIVVLNTGRRRGEGLFRGYALNSVRK